MTNILIAFDGSASARASVQELCRAGLPRDTHATLLSVGEAWFLPPSSFGLVDTETVTDGVLVREADEVARTGLDLLRETFPEWTVHAECRAGSPAREILKYARGMKPDLLVLGSHGRRGFAKFLLGSVSQKVAAEAPCSVRIGRASERPPGPIRLLLAIDGSTGSDAATSTMADRTWPPGTEVRILTATGPTAFDGEGVRTQLDLAHEVQAPALISLRASGLEVSSKTLAADPRELVVDEAAHWPADCIFVGATGFVSLERALFGTVVAAVTARAPCSVEVARFRFDA